MTERVERQDPGFWPSEDQQNPELREHLLLRYRFGKAISNKFGIPLGDVLARYTDLRRRLGLRGRTREWIALVGTLEQAEKHGTDPVEHIVDRCRSAERAAESKRQHEFGSFRFDYLDCDHRISLHFGDIDLVARSDMDVPSFVSADRMGKSTMDLKRMFSFVRRNFPDTQEVVCASWLLNYPALCRLFPPEFTEHMTESRASFSGGSRWGQFMDRNRRLNRERARQLMTRLHAVKSIDAIADAFPLPRKIARASIGYFFRFYGVE